MKKFIGLTLILGISAFFLMALTNLSSDRNNAVVLELFTSQGCSSCPSADKLLKKIKEDYGNQNVITLSYHVDYWNYIGWKDPYSKKEYSTKQTEYNKKFNYRGNYTPELVINGKEHVVGSSVSKVNSALNKYLAKKAENRTSLNNLQVIEDKISFDYTVDGVTDNKILEIILVLDEKVTRVSRGENRNRTLHNSNIVVSENKARLASKGNVSIEIPDIVNQSDQLSIAVIIKDENLDVTGAGKLKVTR